MVWIFGLRKFAETESLDFSMDLGRSNLEFKSRPGSQYVVVSPAENPSNCVFFACNPCTLTVMSSLGARLLAHHAFTIARAPRFQIVCRQNDSQFSRRHQRHCRPQWLWRI